MCLGESTTDGQYPKQLQQILNEKYPNKFSIIDCGISATKLEIILNLLDDNINKYKPDIAICMMGINNGLTDFLHFINIENNDYIKKSKNINFKFYKLFLLIKTHLKFLFKTNNVAYTEEPSQQVISAFTLRMEGKYKEAKLLLEKILKNNPNDEVAYSELIIILNDYYSSSEEQQLSLCNMAINAIDKGIKFRKEWY